MLDYDCASNRNNINMIRGNRKGDNAKKTTYCVSVFLSEIQLNNVYNMSMTVIMNK